MLTLMGVPDAPARAGRIFDLEMKIAQAQAGAVDAQDPPRVQAWSRADFARRAPGIDWDAFFTAAAAWPASRVIAWHPAPITGISALVGSEPIEVWKDWLAFHTASRMAAVLPRAYDDLRFGFYGRTLSGQQQQRPRDRRALLATGAALGDAVGQIYVERHFPASARADVQTMVRNIIRRLRPPADQIDWMAPATRAEARRKVETLIVGVGYPDSWRDYARLEIRPDDAFGNAWRAQEFEYRHQLAKLGRPVDRREWWLSPHTVNAVNLPLQNAINFPAGILEPPFYDRNADPAFNYGAIGSVIGHEISHSFDNLGAGFDAEGRLRNWWTPADLAHFRAAGQALVRQYNAYEALPGPPPQRRADAGREYRRPGRPRRRLRRLSCLAGRPPGAGDRRPDRRPALLPRLCPEPPRARPARRRCAARSPPTSTPPAPGAPRPSATSTPGTRRSTCGPARRCTWRRRIGYGSGSSPSPIGESRRPERGGLRSARLRPALSLLLPAMG